MNDLIYAIRSLRKSPGLLAVSLLSLGLGIGANTTLLSVFKSLFLHTPTVREPGRIYRLREIDKPAFTYPQYRELRTSTSLAGLAGYSMSRVNVRVGSDVQQIYAMTVTPDFFEVLGSGPVWGRSPAGIGNQVVVSHGFWRGQLQSAPDAVGRGWLSRPLPPATFPRGASPRRTRPLL